MRAVAAPRATEASVRRLVQLSLCSKQGHPNFQGMGPKRDIVVVGGSAGGLEALQQLVSGLPKDFPAALFVVLHSAPDLPTYIAEILSRSTALPVSLAVHGEAVKAGKILVAPPDNHMTLDGRFVRVVRGPKDNGHRPAVDPLFQTAARAYGSRVIGVVLSGSLSCGTQGLVSIVSRGGLGIVQDPSDALNDGMALSALAHVQVNHVLPAREMGALLARLVNTQASESTAMASSSQTTNGPLSPQNQFPAITCPECNGSMVETHDGGFIRFACHVGHTFSLDSLVYEQSAALEAALWASVRVLEESAEMARRVALRSDRQLSKRFEEKSVALLQHAEVIKELLTSGNLISRSDAADANLALTTAASK
jgi:two-component system, chemotaxis family, protein-glutamate methylesterase/glutaminase